jgi:hypothetical protein
MLQQSIKVSLIAVSSQTDLEILGEQSDTTDVTGNTNSAGAASGGTGAPAKKAKIMLTEEEQTFAKKFQPAASKNDKPRRIDCIDLRHVSGRGASLKKQGSRKHYVKPRSKKT